MAVVTRHKVALTSMDPQQAVVVYQSMLDCELCLQRRHYTVRLGTAFPARDVVPFFVRLLE
jgi:hypothetical protein